MDRDLSARQEARDLAQRAQQAQQILKGFSQEQLDRITEAMARAFEAQARPLAELAVRETGFGNPEDKEKKNHFAARQVLQAIRPMKTVGILKQEPGLWEVGVSVGVIAAIVPSTNPTSTVCYKALIALKAGNTVVFSPHPKAVQCTLRAAEIMMEAARQAGAPEGSIGCLTQASLAGCQELMTADPVRLILATGGPAMVKAAYTSGKPAIGVGAGNGPAYLHRSADIRASLLKILRSKTFDNGTICASEQSILVEKAMETQVLREADSLGFYLMSREEADRLGRILFRPSGALNPEIVGKTAKTLAEKAGFSLPEGKKVLLARENGVGPGHPYSMEKLCPVLALYVEEDEDRILSRAIEILTFEGSGHSFVFHGTDEGVIRRFCLQIPVSRFLVNTPAALGGIGAETKLFPALTLGCGAVGGSSSSNNVSPMDLLNIRRVAWGREGLPERPDEDLVDRIAEKILERLENGGQP